MSIICSRDEFARAITLAGRGVPARRSDGGVLLRGEEGRMLVAGTDMEMSLGMHAEATVEQDGSVVFVPGRVLVDTVRLLPAGEVKLDYDSDKQTLGVACGSASYRLKTARDGNYPRLPDVEADSFVTVSRQALLDTVTRVRRAAAKAGEREILTGILVCLENRRLVMVATDSYRLAVKETRLEQNVGQKIEAIVPARALDELVRVARASGAEGVSVGVQENQIVFVVGGVVLSTRLIDGRFPNYLPLRPKSFATEVRFSREGILDMVRRVGVVAEQHKGASTHSTPLRLRFEDGELYMRASDESIGEVTETLPVSHNGDDMEIWFNPVFLREGLEQISGPEVNMSLVAPRRPGLITGANDGFWYLIMPIMQKV